MQSGNSARTVFWEFIFQYYLKKKNIVFVSVIQVVTKTIILTAPVCKKQLKTAEPTQKTDM